MSECCANCGHCYRFTKLDYSNGGCIHTEMDGYICMAFRDEREACWMMGQDINTGLCECWSPQSKNV